MRAGKQTIGSGMCKRIQPWLVARNPARLADGRAQTQVGAGCLRKKRVTALAVYPRASLALGCLLGSEGRVEGFEAGCYNRRVPHALSVRIRLSAPADIPPSLRRVTNRSSQEPAGASAPGSGQVAQVVERSPEKAGVGGSTPSLATIILKNLAESRLTLPVRSQSALFRRDPVRFPAAMMVKDLTSSGLSLSPLSVRFSLQRD